MEFASIFAAFVVGIVSFFLFSLLMQVNRAKALGRKYYIQMWPGGSIIHLFGFSISNWISPYNLKLAFQNDFNDRLKSDFVAIVNPFSIEFVTSNVKVAKQIITEKKDSFGKPQITLGGKSKDVETGGLFKNNMIVMEGKEWRRHRKIGAVGFTERNNRLVVSKTVGYCIDMRNEFLKQIKEKGVARVDILPYALKVALSVICSSSFGIPCDWEGGGAKSVDEEMSFFHALELITENPAFCFMFSSGFLSKFPFAKPQLLSKAIKSYYKFTKEKIATTRAELAASKNSEMQEDRKDLFFNLIKASEFSEGDEKLTLDEMELHGNIFLFLLAGHETSAHTMTFALGLLALNPSAQEKIFEEVKTVIGEKKDDMTYEEVNNLKYTAAVMNEALRLFPVLPRLGRLCAQGANVGENDEVYVPPNSQVAVSILGIHMSEKYWGADVKDFKPERFLGEYNKDAFLTFSDGPRVCLGKRFAQLEIVVLLASLVRDFKITCDDPKQSANDLLSPTFVVTLVPSKPVNLTFTPRS